ncbi:MAG TPA: pyridoxal-dependent decarboxylase [Steroidobacteraceae bacterium]|nr:pyridoxal-dependent decarboxylase [Steroidobacteraceae bacterium]
MGSSDDLIRRIRELERTAAPLEPDAVNRRVLLQAVATHAEDFLERLPTAFVFETNVGPAAELAGHRPCEEPAALDELLGLFRRSVEDTGLKASSAGHVAYIPGGGLYASALGDYLAAVTNEYAGVRFAGPGAVEMENVLLRWMGDLAGYPAAAQGNLTSGGSVANLIAVVTAREAGGLRCSDVPRAVVYLTTQTHHSLEKALRIAGLGECVVRQVATDACHRMAPGALRQAIADDRAAGLRPWLVAAAAGSTDVGAIDPLESIGQIAAAERLWYHVDAAYGGFFLLCPEMRGRLRGLERSDSLVMDPHKGLFVPYGLGAVLVRDGAMLARAHYYHADYMQDAVAGSPATDSPADLSPELSRHFRGPRLWLPLLLHGVTPFRACLEEKRLLIRYFHEQVRSLGFEVGPDPELTVSTYRWVPESGDPDAFNEALVQAIHRDGRVFVSSTRIGGRFFLRLAVLSFRTHLDTVELTLRVLAEKVAELRSAGAQRPPGKRQH